MRQIADYADIFITAPLCFGYLWAAAGFCKKYLGASKKDELLFVCSAMAGRLLLEAASRQYPLPYIFPVMLYHIFFMGLVLLLFRSDREKKILAAAILMAAAELAENFCESFLSCLVLFVRYTAERNPNLCLGGRETALILCIRYIFVTVIVCRMSDHSADIFSGRTGRWYVTLAVPLFAVTTMTDVVNWGAANGIMVKSGGSRGLYYDQLFGHMEICLLTGLSVFAAGFYVFGMVRIYTEQEKNSRYHFQLAVYRMLEEQYRQSERLRHDMKNHIIALSGLFQSGEWEKMGHYLKQLESSSLESAGDVTGNKSVDALLYQKRKWAEREQIRWECDVQIPKVCSISEFDLCILFGNLLDNALEACERLGRMLPAPEDAG